MLRLTALLGVAIGAGAKAPAEPRRVARRAATFMVIVFY
jgi:hypothetical protein